MSETPLRAAIAAVMASQPEVPARMLQEANGGQRPGPQDLARATEKARGLLRSRQVAALRGQAVLDAAEGIREGAGCVPVTLPTGQVIEFESITQAPGYPDGMAVRLRPLGAPRDGTADLVIVNPPTLVRDHRGDIDAHGVKHREDPLGALGEVVQRMYRPGSGA